MRNERLNTRKDLFKKQGAVDEPRPSSRGGTKKWYSVYLLRSMRDGSLYVGCTSNLRKRMEEHRKGMNFSTKKALPIELIYLETFVSKKDAFQREKRLKQYGSGMRNLKLRLVDTLRKREAGTCPAPRRGAG